MIAKWSDGNVSRDELREVGQLANDDCGPRHTNNRPCPRASPANNSVEFLAETVSVGYVDDEARRTRQREQEDGEKSNDI